MYAGGARLAHVLEVVLQQMQHKSDMQHNHEQLPDPLITSSPDVLAGTPVFNGTQVPVQVLMDHVDARKPLDDFLRDFPDVSLDHVIAVLDEAPPPPPVDPDFVPDPLIMICPEMLSGQPVFNGTRVPIQALFDYIEGGDPLDEFLDGFPDVSRAHAIAVLEFARKSAVAMAAE